MFIVAYFPTKRKEDFTMKKFKNMNLQEAEEAFSKWEAKHPRNDDFDMSGLQMMKYAELLGRSNREELLTLICDIFNHGFMCGYKQSEANQKVVDEALKQYKQQKGGVSA